MDLTDKKVLILGASGMVGRAVRERLSREDPTELYTPSSSEVDLTDSARSRQYFLDLSPDLVVVSAAKVGGILANDTLRADFLHQNLMIAANSINAAHEASAEKLIFLGSSCIYPREASQPINEESLLTGPLEPTNEPYAIAKIAGLKLCESYFRQFGDNFFSLMPTNLYGPFDNFDPETSHVIPGLINKFHSAQMSGDDTVSVWGTGKPLREFMYVNDLADAIAFALKYIDARHIFENGISHLNVGTGSDISIRELCTHIAQISGFDGEILFDQTKPDGMPRKLMDSGRMKALGWSHSIDLEDGLRDTYDWYLANFPGNQ
jgi:nucleoside-diphosphate-sugar epimerase